MGRFVIKYNSIFYGGEAPSGLESWTGKLSRATKFQTKEQAESYALLMSSGENPDLIGKIEVVDLDEWERQNAKHG